MSDKTGYKLFISKKAKDNLKKFKHIMEHTSMNETIDWLFSNPGEGAKKLAVLASVLKRFRRK